jgi:hypothetical protein
MNPGGQMIDGLAKNARRTEHISLNNSETHALQLIIEPWAEELVMPPGARYDIIFEGPSDHSLRIDIGERKVVIYGWSGSIVSVFDKKRILCDYPIPVPDVP